MLSVLNQSTLAPLPVVDVRRIPVCLGKLLLLVGLLGGRVTPAGGSANAANRSELAASRHQAVLALQPVGYWPADQGEGAVLHDLSSTGNHGVIHHVPWDEQRQLLRFTGAYQWLEIPKHAAYQTPAFSMGGWVFLRSEVIGSGWVNRQGLLLIGNRHWLNGAGAQLCVRKQQVIDVVSDGQEDVLGTRLYASTKDGMRVERAYGEHSLAIGQWHHLLYTFAPNAGQAPGKKTIGTGKLYLNGKLIATTADVGYQPANASLQIGNDAYWWHQMASKSGSLDGALRDMIWFNRALAGEEAAQLCRLTKPAAAPDLYDDTVVVLDGRAIAVHDLASLPPPTRQTALRLFGRKPAATLQPLAPALLPALTAALDEPNGRRQAVQLLLKLDNDAATTALQTALPKLLAAVQDQESAEAERADAALALAALGAAAAEAVPALADSLDKLVPDAGIQPPRVEELLRNALTRALLDIASKHEQARSVVERTFAKPMVDALDTSKPGLESLVPRIKQGRYLEAMQIHGKLHHTVREYFFTHKAPQDRDYTATAHFNGATYKVGEGVAWKGVEKVAADDYPAVVAELVEQSPAAQNWRDPDYEHLYRVPLTRVSADGQEQKVYLEGKNFILDGSDAKCRAWSIFVDERGHVHVMGGQHNTPNPNLYIPGSWEKIGVSRDKQNEEYPLQMYWVSTEPESIEAFEFAGQRGNPRAIPASYLNYLCFVQSPSNETYLYGRAAAFGWQCWGMFRYAAAEKRWTPVGGDPYELIESARRNDPTWIDYLHDPVRGFVPKQPSDTRRLAWAWQPPFYNFCRDGWGVRFDKTGRMHVRMTISGLDGAGYVRPTSVYAWSDDRGRSFHRPDGSAVKLPLTVNPAPEHNAEIDCDNTLQHHTGDQYATRQWWELWLGLLRDAGYRI